MSNDYPSDADIDRWIETVNELGRGLSSWEEGFMANVTEQVEQRGAGCLSEAQRDILERIYAQKTPDGRG